jgi:hypothetical protein
MGKREVKLVALPSQSKNSIYLLAHNYYVATTQYANYVLNYELKLLLYKQS